MDVIALVVLGFASLLASLYFLSRKREEVPASLLAVLTILIGGLIAANAYYVAGNSCVTTTQASETIQTCTILTQSDALYSSLATTLIGAGAALLIIIVIKIIIEEPIFR
jgi:choline kinase